MFHFIMMYLMVFPLTCLMSDVALKTNRPNVAANVHKTSYQLSNPVEDRYRYV